MALWWSKYTKTNFLCANDGRWDQETQEEVLLYIAYHEFMEFTATQCGNSNCLDGFQRGLRRIPEEVQQLLEGMIAI